MPAKFEKAIQLIDNENSKDIRKEYFDSKAYPKELLYSYRMTNKLLEFQPNASDALKLAARAQHICRWKIPRDEYPMDRIGYLKWRETLKKMHADLTTDILRDVGYDQQYIDRVKTIMLKKHIHKNEESQILEDTICLVFLDYYLEAFVEKHENEKIINILQKTLKKMSERGQEAAFKLNFSSKVSMLLKQATQ